MKRYYLTTIIICVLALLAFSFIFHFWDQEPEISLIKVGFLSENDEMTANTYNFEQSQAILQKEFDERIEIISLTNVRSDETGAALVELVRNGCSIIFANTRSPEVKTTAALYPEVQFCQLSNGVPAAVKSGDNYHTFNAKIYQGHYVAGAVAGMKMQEMINNGVISQTDALVGYVGSYPTAEVISGYTAFILGVRSVVPDALMRVRYTNVLSSFSQEKAAARQLINEGCVIIAQNSGTSGPAAACQDAALTRMVYHVGYNESMVDVAPMVSLVSPRANWDPYMVSAVRAVMTHQPIEKVTAGEVHGNDLCAGFEEDWVEMLELNENVAAAGSKAKIAELTKDFRNGKIDVFRGDYIGVNPDNMRITFDLNDGFTENSASSKPAFRYILRGVVTVVK
ncbi:MAG: BMP family ABC transporter substrate-binding protein [Anaerolineaceae bacterium]|nr:BMP family ABC transporter substrate-binding protein [Anaerolineaceae bacterium]